MDCFFCGFQGEKSEEWVRKNMEGKKSYTLVSEALWAIEEKKKLSKTYT